MKHRLALGLLILALNTSCGSIAINTTGNSTDTSTSTSVSFSQVNALDSFLFVFATDYLSSGQLYLASLDGNTATLTATGVSALGSSAKIRLFDDLLYVLHDGYSLNSSDNLQILDPTDSYATTGQWSVGNGTNPWDVAVIGLRAFVSLYNPSADPSNIDANFNPGDVVEMNIATGTITHRYSFADYLEDDGDKQANAGFMLLSEELLFVVLQDLESNTFEPTASGKVGMVDTSTHAITGVLELQGRNPTSLALSHDSRYLFISHQAPYSFDLQNFDTTTAYGGIEVYDLATLSTALFLDDEDLGGYVERLVANETDVYAVVSSFENGSFTSTIVTFPQDLTSISDASLFDDGDTDIRDIAISEDHLWVSRQESGNSNPQLEIFDLTTGNPLSTLLEPVATGVSLATQE